MDDVLRKRLSPEELEQYERYDSRASIAGHFVVWPAIAGLVSFFGDKPVSQWICLAIVLAAFPVMVVMGKRAGKMRQLAEERFGVIMGQSADKKNAQD
ncbi:MAG: hypothetical protein ACI89J_004499 [Hyphomicrobiaceae bacterium]|jgi:hypothetical protein